jgi:cytochrome c553
MTIFNQGIFTMAKRIPVVLAMTLAAALGWQPATAQTAKARATAKVDLEARFKEVQSSPALTDSLYKTGRKVAAVCANCHGDGGNSTRPSIPNLAGQNPAYLLEQLRQFADGRRRNEFMEGMIRAMDADEKIGMVLFYADQEVAHKPAKNTALAGKGQEYYGKICFRCHGTSGRGNDQIARIAGQQDEYLRLTLKRYRDGNEVRANSIMTPNTKNMTDADIEAVVAYVSSMP